MVKMTLLVLSVLICQACSSDAEDAGTPATGSKTTVSQDALVLPTTDETKTTVPLAAVRAQLVVADQCLIARVEGEPDAVVIWPTGARAQTSPGGEPSVATPGGQTYSIGVPIQVRGGYSSLPPDAPLEAKHCVMRSGSDVVWLMAD